MVAPLVEAFQMFHHPGASTDVTEIQSLEGRPEGAVQFTIRALDPNAADTEIEPEVPEGVNVIVALPTFVLSATDVALTVTVCCVVTLDGAV